MVIERFKEDNAESVYRRFFEKGRMAPDGLTYFESWVDLDMKTCFQIMECPDIRLIHEWIGHWQDLVDFEVVPVVSSQEAQAKMRTMGQDA
jgi:hypothetical protein